MKKGTIPGIIFMAAFRLMGIVALISGIRMVGEGVYNYVNEHSQQDWIPATAYTSSISSKYYSSTDKGKSGEVRYNITYQYEVDGKTYSDVLYNRSEAMGIGDQITIKYDPEHPEDSTDILSPSLSNLIVFLAFGTGFSIAGYFLSGAWALIQRIRHRGEPEEEEILPPEEYVNPEERRRRRR